MSEVKVSKARKLLMSWWIFLTIVFGPYNFLLFAYGGFRSRNKKLVYVAYLYAIPVFLRACHLGYIAHYVLPITWIAGFIHALLIRKSYVNRRVELIEIKQKRYDVQRVNIPVQEPSIEPEQMVSQIMEETRINLNKIDSKPMEESRTLTDINNCTVEELMQLPFMTEILAKKAIEEREKRNGFMDLEDFGAALELKPHMLEKIRPLVKIEESIKEEESLEKGRVLDL